MTKTTTHNNEFIARHVGPNIDEQHVMLADLGYKDLDSFLSDAIPDAIHQNIELDLDAPISEASALACRKFHKAGWKRC